MNRADRRAARRRGRGQPDCDCGCTTRLLRPVEPRVTCSCGESRTVPDLPMPTGSPLASLMTVHVGCVCGEEIEVPCYVDVL